MSSSGSRAIVLGGGGVTGIAWELGVLNGLLDAEVDLGVDAVYGTSAGAFVGAALASEANLRELYERQRRPTSSEPVVRPSRSLYLAWAWAYLVGWGNPRKIGAGLGRIALRRRSVQTAAQRRTTVQSRLTTTEWPPALSVTAIDARSGTLHVFERADACPLVDAVSASGAVPGLSEPVEIARRLWIDGGMVSSTNARVAEGYDQILVVAPLPTNHGGMASAAEEVGVLGGRARVALITPDRPSREAIGRNIYDASRRDRSAEAGRRQGSRSAPRVPWA